MAGTNDLIQQLANGIRRGVKNTGDKVDVSQFLKNLVAYSTGSQPVRDTLQNIQNVSLASRVKRAETPEFTTDQLANMGGSENFMALPENQAFQDQLAESQFANQALQSELANPTANKNFNRIFNVSPEEQQRQSGAQLYGITPENPQGKVFSPTVTRDLTEGLATMLSAATPGLTKGMDAVPGAFARIGLNTAAGAGQGFGESVPSSAGMDTLLGMLLSGGGSAVSEYADNPEFRQFIKDKNSGKYDAYMIMGSDLVSPDDIADMRAKAYASAGVSDADIQKLNDYYTGKGATNRNPMLNDLELLQRNKPTAEGLQYLEALQNTGAIDKGQIKIPLMAYRDDLSKAVGQSRGLGKQAGMVGEKGVINKDNYMKVLSGQETDQNILHNLSAVKTDELVKEARKYANMNDFINAQEWLGNNQITREQLADIWEKSIGGPIGGL